MGTSTKAIGVWGATLKGLAGRFDGEVKLNAFNNPSRSVTVINGALTASGTIQSDALKSETAGTGNCLYADANGIIRAKGEDCGTGSGSGGGVAGTGTTNYFAICTSSTTLGTSTILMSSGGQVGIGTTTLLSALHVVSATSPQFKIGYNSTNYTTFGTASNGKLKITPSGSDTTMSGILRSGSDLYVGGTSLYINGVLMLSCDGGCPSACGDTLTDSRDGKTYATVLIGSQCWMKQNINIGTRIAGTSNQTDNAIIEKYCYQDTDANCDSSNNPNYPDGGLYQWDEAMQYVASCNGTGEPPNDACAAPVQGICPSGWHIPSHYELTTLEKNVGSNPGAFPYDESTTGWLGTNEGTNLKPNGSSGFEGNLAGYRSTGGSFFSRGTYALIWSSLESGSSAWRRYLYSGFATVNRAASSELYGFSVRCVQD